MSLAHHSNLSLSLVFAKDWTTFLGQASSTRHKSGNFSGGKPGFFFSNMVYSIYRASPLSPIHSVLFENSSRMPSFFDNMFKFCMGYGSTNFLSYKKAKKKLLTCTLKVADAAYINAMKERQNTPDVFNAIQKQNKIIFCLF